VTTPLDLASRYAGLDAGARAHLERLMATWGMLADLSFSDLLLYVPLLAVDEAAEGAPLRADRPRQLVVLGQIRPTTAQTLLEDDLVGQVVSEASVPVVSAALHGGSTSRGQERDALAGGSIEVQCVPVRHRGEVVAVLYRAWSPSGRGRGHLEATYLDLFDRFAAMVADGVFPFLEDHAAIGEAPRVGDGVIIVDERSRITFASPNAVSALHRMGVISAQGSALAAVGVQTSVIEQAMTWRVPVIDEVERHGEVTVLFRCIPLVVAGRVTGALVLVRDVTDLRRRDRMLLSKDAAIREVHHRVKNNLQTISSLLRLQARRVEAPGQRDVLAEAERRIRSIALVHELLSREAGDQVPFDEIVHSLVVMAKESQLGGGALTLRVDGDAGRVATDVATPLAVVLAELLQNAVEHAFVEDGASGGAGPAGSPAQVDLVLRHEPEELLVEVRDNGRGLPPGFDLERPSGLGLAIVRDLVRTQLGGTISASSEGGTVVRLTVPLRPHGGRSG
jgi:two-component sensor histidine kinase/PAS domain-containing protein